MRQFVNKWYGDDCPYWTWPATISGIGVFMALALYVVNVINLADCKRRGGNTVTDNVCYHVTMKKID